jgi:putative SOS response-associated peptidase YedK
MCGRYDIHSEGETIAQHFDVVVSVLLKPHFNAAPSQQLPLITNANPTHLSLGSWGFLPKWRKPDSSLKPVINARSETVATKSLFKSSFLKRRCIIPADAFYEWKRRGHRKTPYRIGLKSHELFALAGIWDTYPSTDGLPLLTFAILTTAPNDLLAFIHNRMPVILPREHYCEWLDPTAHPENPKDLFTPYPSDVMEAYEISTRINSPAHNSPDLIEPV